jgi:hypothetical protein
LVYQRINAMQTVRATTLIPRGVSADDAVNVRRESVSGVWRPLYASS